MKAHGGDLEQLLQDRRQQMLPAMLLHVVEASGPVDLGVDFAGGDRRVEHVDHAVSLIDYLDDFRRADLSGIEGLPARGGIEGGAVQIYPPTVVPRFDHPGAKLLEVAVLIVESF